MKKGLLIVIGLALMIGSFASAGPTVSKPRPNPVSSISCGMNGC